MKRRIVLIATTVFILILEMIYSRRCGIDLLKKPKRILVKQENDNLRQLKEEQWESIRIHLDYSYIENNLGKFENQDYIDLKEKIMPKTKEVFEKLLRVKRSNSKLKLPYQNCDQLTIPEKYQEDQEGVDADIVIFVLIDDTGYFLQNHVEAAAIHCFQNSVTRRPIAGYIQFKPQLRVDDKTAQDYMVWLAIHEITHILVMNDSLYEDWIDSNMKQLGLSNVVGSRMLSNGKKMNFLKTPKILEKGKEHFGCSSFEGAALEYNGGPGTTGAHWSKRIMNTDYMIGDSYGENLISDLTLAMFEDSGWYKVDYNLSNLFLWGKNKGCDFLKQSVKCVEKRDNQITTKFTPEFCTKINYPVCSTSNIFRANCRTRRYKFLNSAEQYFSDSTLGGVDILSDKCPIPIEVKQGQNYYGGSCRVGQSKKINQFEKICPECACFMSNLRLTSKKSNQLRFQETNDKKEIQDDVEDEEYLNESKSTTADLKSNNTVSDSNIESKNTTQTLDNRQHISSILKKNFLKNEPLPELNSEDYRSHCFEFKCEGEQLYVKVNDKAYKCNEKDPVTIEGFKGNIQCPPSNVLCHSKFKCKFGCTEKYSNTN